MNTQATLWATRARFFRDERKASLALYRSTRDPRWIDQARTELERELEAIAIVNHELDLEQELFHVA